MPPKSPEKKSHCGSHNSHSNNRRKKKDFVASSTSSSSGSCSNAYSKCNKAERSDPGALILKLLHNGRSDEADAPQINSNVRSQSRSKHFENMEQSCKAHSESLDATMEAKGSAGSTLNLFTTPPPQRRGRYSVFSSCGTNNQKCISYSNSGSGKSLASGSSNPTNFALPMYMRSPNPESIPMPCGFPIG
ncbi:hypothetical protein HWI79_3312 [Cryptosporidium felis]|nr:hypothetical protein HWI79_3312 [Cryptosporidium felis]